MRNQSTAALQAQLERAMAGDVGGHGVGSSLLAVSAANLPSAGSLPDTDFRGPGAVASSRSGQRRTRGEAQSVQDRLAFRRRSGPG